MADKKTSRKPAAKTARAADATRTADAASSHDGRPTPPTYRFELVNDDEPLDVVRAKKLQLLAELVADLAESHAEGDWHSVEVVLDQSGMGCGDTLLRVEGARSAFMAVRK